MFLTKAKEPACVALSENIANEWPRCSVSFDQSDNAAESLCGLWRDDRVAKIYCQRLGQSHVLQRFLPAELSCQGKIRIQRRTRRPRPVRCRVVGPGRVRAVLMFLKLYCFALPIFFGMDMIWLGVAAKNFYTKQIGFLMTPKVNWAAAILFYLLFLAGLVVFVIAPAVEKDSWVRALLFGALFGLISYATYDLTNLATLKDWPLALTVVDLIWGTILAGSVSVGTYLIAHKFGL